MLISAHSTTPRTLVQAIMTFVTMHLGSLATALEASLFLDLTLMLRKRLLLGGPAASMHLVTVSHGEVPYAVTD